MKTSFSNAKRFVIELIALITLVIVGAKMILGEMISLVSIFQ